MTSTSRASRRWSLSCRGSGRAGSAPFSNDTAVASLSEMKPRLRELWSLRPGVVEERRTPEEISVRARAVEVLRQASIPFLLGGAYAFFSYTGIFRDTKDIDLFPRRRDALAALAAFEADGWATERTDEVWLFKAFKGPWFVDLIFSSGNGMADVDDEWFHHATPHEWFGQEVWVTPPEELLWSKAFVLERERFDGSDVTHLIHAMGPLFDWNRLLRRFGDHWEVLLSHLLLYRYTYPSEREVVPRWLLELLLQRTGKTMDEGNCRGRLCRGRYLSSVNYSVDLDERGYEDARAQDERLREGR